MKPPLRILHLEDNASDADLIQARLESEGIVSHVTRVETQADFVASLERGSFNIILADYTLPSFDGLSALKIALEKCPDVPFIFVSGTLGEELAIEALKIGATDYLLKERLARIVPSVRRALREAKERTERKRAEDAARAARARFEGILEIAKDAIICVNSHQHIILFNQGAEKVFGYTQAEVIGHPLDLLLPQRFEDVHRKHVEDFARSPDVARTMGNRREVSGRRRDGGEFPAEASISKLGLGGELVFTVILRDVTERKRAEEERQAHLWSLAESERKLEEAQRLTHVGYWDRDLNTDLITWSNETYRIHGVSPEERILTIGRVQELIHAEDRQMVIEAVAAALRDGPRYDVEYRVVRPNGEVRIVHSQGDVTWDETGRPRRMFGTAQDITERKRVEQRLMAKDTVTQILAEAATLQEATPRLLQTVCECLAWDLGALWRIDREAGVLRCVEVWYKESVEVPHFEAISREITFLPGIGLPGRVWSSREPRYISDLVHEAHFPRSPIAATEGLHAAFGFPILLGGESLGVLEFFSREIRQPDEGLLKMMATVGSQIGQFIERKQAEEAFHKAQAELAHVTRVTTLGELATSIAHEVNQPLAAVVTNGNACARWLAGEPPNLDEARECLSRIIRDGSRAGEMIARIRSLVKRSASAKERLDLNETIQEVLAITSAEARQYQVSVRTELAANLPPVRGDRVQLQQVLLNLVMNGMEAMQAVADRPRDLIVRSQQEESDAIGVAVRDAGTGIDPQNLERIFTAFVTTKPGGLGMGLAISRSIIEAHGGRLWAEPNDGPGATFQFSLPTGGSAA